MSKYKIFNIRVLIHYLLLFIKNISIEIEIFIVHKTRKNGKNFMIDSKRFMEK